MLFSCILSRFMARSASMNIMEFWFLTVTALATVLGTTNAACSPCPFKWLERHDFCYRFFPDPQSYNDADARCQRFSYGGRRAVMATVTSLEDLQILSELVDEIYSQSPGDNLPKYIWLGNNSHEDPDTPNLQLILHRTFGSKNDVTCANNTTNSTEYQVMGDEGIVRLVSAPDVVEQCAVYVQTGSYLDLGDFQGSCVSDPGQCQTRSATWSFWLKINTTSGYTGNRYYVSSGGQTKLARGVALFYKSNEAEFGITWRTEQFWVSQRYDSSKVPTNTWFHLTWTLDITNMTGSALTMFVDGKIVEPDGSIAETETPHSDRCTHLYLGMSNTCGSTYSATVYGGTASYSNLMVFDGLLNKEQIRDLCSCGYLDWGVNMRNLSVTVANTSRRYECTTSGTEGIRITWRLYDERTRSWSDLGVASGYGYTVKAANLSACMVQSTLTLNADQGDTVYVACTANTPTTLYNASVYILQGRHIFIGFSDQGSSGLSVRKVESTAQFIYQQDSEQGTQCAAEPAMNEPDYCTADYQKHPYICKLGKRFIS